MDIKSKNRHKLAVVIIAVVIYISAQYAIQQYYYEWNRAATNVIILALFVGFIALVLPFVRSFQTGDEIVFKAYAEIPCLITLIMGIIMFSNMDWMIQRNGRIPDMMDEIVWCWFYGSVYWSVGNLRRMAVIGTRTYLKKYTLSYKLYCWLKKNGKKIKNETIDHANHFYHSFEEIDFHEKNNKVILKIVAVNFLILLVICFFWLFGLIGLVIYSVMLFFILRRYFNDLRGKYALLLQATNQIAEGNLDVKLEEDLGVFNPFKTEIEKIQQGFKKALEEEVKSQKMKTELITNVSHDLKTPLTAIITYVDLLKHEKDEERREGYVEVLERKSLRLKVLIEDLFEISKASSDNATLELVNVDIVNLFKQVKFELEDKIKAAELDFHMNFPEEKLILLLDSQKTYRIFENLLVNITKYSMPHTRVYVDMIKEENEAVIYLKNISATELKFHSEEITERFVRGDEARNTEGSGLGLAIVKSFTELQKGTLKIVTDADLFKVELRFPFIALMS